MLSAWRSSSAVCKVWKGGFLAACLLCSSTGVAWGAEGDPELLGLVIDGREVGTLAVIRRGDDFFLPLDGFGELLGVTVEREGHSTILDTPLGRVALAPFELEAINGRVYLPGDTLTARLATRLSFDASTYALTVEPPWNPSSAVRGSRFSRRTLEPEIFAPQSSISGLQGDLTHTRTGDSSNLYGHVQARGRFQRGLWKVRLQDSEAGPFQMRDYYWFTRRGKSSHLGGRQRLQLHPGLGSFDMAGYQFGWTNRPAERWSTPGDSNVVVPRRSRPSETFSGHAPPGSYVRLRIDGRVVASQQVGFNGQFEFYDVVLPSRQMAQIEVLIYDRHNRQVPVETRRFRLATSDLLLPSGAMVHTGGVGASGQFTEGFMTGTPGTSTTPGAFYQWRQGLTEGITGESAIQYAGERMQAYSGVIARLADAWVMSTGVSYTPGAVGHSATLEAYRPRWRMFVRSESTPGDFSLFGTGFDRSNHSLEFFGSVSRNLTLGMTARAYDDGTREASYVLPSMTWRGGRSFYLDARPDVYGDYLGNVSWTIDAHTQARLFTSQNSELELTHDFGDRYQMAYNAGFGGGLPVRNTLSVTRRALTLRGWGLQAGLVRTQGMLGFMAAGNTPVLPGLYARAEYQSIPYRSFNGTGQTGRLLLSLSMDLSQVGGRMVPSRSAGGLRERGAVAGRVIVDFEDEASLETWSSRNRLGGIAILVDDRVGGRTEVGGRFYLPNLQPGYHVIELDPEYLPIELNPVRKRFVVEVASGSATRVDFNVKPEFGLAGRVTNLLGEAVPDLRLVLADASGLIVATALSDRFGLFRMDGVPPGGYTLRALSVDDGRDTPVAQREVLVQNDFLFDQDLRIDLVDAPRPILVGAAGSKADGAASAGASATAPQ